MRMRSFIHDLELGARQGRDARRDGRGSIPVGGVGPSKGRLKLTSVWRVTRVNCGLSSYHCTGAYL
jgi:hypothetical protein